MDVLSNVDPFLLCLKIKCLHLDSITYLTYLQRPKSLGIFLNCRVVNTNMLILIWLLSYWLLQHAGDKNWCILIYIYNYLKTKNHIFVFEDWVFWGFNFLTRVITLSWMSLYNDVHVTSDFDLKTTTSLVDWVTTISLKCYRQQWVRRLIYSGWRIC